jgi:hypothetical protein
MIAEHGRHTVTSVFGGSIVARLRRVPIGGTIELSQDEVAHLLEKAMRAEDGGILETGKMVPGTQHKHTHAWDLQQIVHEGKGTFFGRQVKLK